MALKQTQITSNYTPPSHFHPFVLGTQTSVSRSKVGFIPQKWQLSAKYRQIVDYSRFYFWAMSPWHPSNSKLVACSYVSGLIHCIIISAS